jgi:hypothetical protein
MAVAERIHAPQTKTARAVPANVVTITPKMAEEMLGKNVKNRRVSKHTVEAYARDMISGSWKFTGEAIKFDRDGSLQDGQHRLLACIKAEQPFTTLIVYDLDADVQEVMDTGRLRTVADALTINGQAFATRIAGAARWLNTVKVGNELWKNRRVTHAEQMSILRRHPGIAESAAFVGNAYGMSPGLLTCIHYVGANLLDNAPFANEFVTIFITGNSYDGCAAHAWRERLMRMKAAKTPITHMHMYKGSVHAWNLFAAGKTVKFVRPPDSVEFDGLDLSLI